VSSAVEAAGGGPRLNRGRTPDRKSRQGRPKVAHGFNRGSRVERAQSPEGAKEKMRPERRVLSSLTGLDSYSRPNPAMNRWAILERPCGTSTHDTLNTCGRRRRSQSSNPIFGVGGSDCPTFRSARVSLVTSAATREGVFERAVSRRGCAGFRTAAFFSDALADCAIGRGRFSSRPGY